MPAFPLCVDNPNKLFLKGPIDSSPTDNSGPVLKPLMRPPPWHPSTPDFIKNEPYSTPDYAKGVDTGIGNPILQPISKLMNPVKPCTL